ncbi:MAG: type II toxin-antitoxin system RelE/ParE family toxin [Gemmatimonadota bacterium]|nr:type II toxin-antitoxin system RelE/ParE family toxin [Gemmatimonadota bacterium]
MPRVRFRQQARAEIREARGWYEGQVAGLGRVFIAELDATLGFLQLHPDMYSSVSDDGRVRRALLHRFPYSLVYEVMNADEIIVLACRHVRQDEVNWNLARRDV